MIVYSRKYIACLGHAAIREYILIDYNGNGECEIMHTPTNGNSAWTGLVHIDYLYVDQEMDTLLTLHQIMDALKLIPFERFFNVDDPTHINAYICLQETGQWPDGFIPTDVVVSDSFLELIRYKMSESWVEFMLSNGG